MSGPTPRSTRRHATDASNPADGTASPPPAGRPSIAERAARRDQLQAGGRDRYGALLRSLQAGQELPLRGRGTRIALAWHPVLGTLLKVALVIAIVYVAARAATEWWRENNVDTWSGPTLVQSGVRLAGCPVVDAIRVDEFPSWIAYEGNVYRYTGSRRPYVGPETPGYTATGHSSGSMHLVLVDVTPDGQARDTVMIWLEGALAGIEYARTPDCTPPAAGRS